MSNPFDSPTVVRLAAGIYGDYVHERDLHAKPNPQNWGFQPQFGQSGHQPWVQALFSGNPNQVQRALDVIGVAQADQPTVKAALAAIDGNVALTVYKLLQAHIAAHSAHPSTSASPASSGGASGHTY